MDTEIGLCQEYQEWCRMNHLPAMSADELVHEDYLTAEHRKYLAAFIERWETVMASYDR